MKSVKDIKSLPREITTDRLFCTEPGGSYEWLFIATAEILQRKINNTPCIQELK